MYDPETLTAAGYRKMVDDPATGRQVWVLLDGDKLHVKEFAAVDALLSENAAIRSETAGTSYGDGAVVARIPEHILHNRLMEPIRQGDKAYIDRWLNDSDHAKFRTRDGRI